MTSSPKSTTDAAARIAEPPFAAAGGVPYAPKTDRPPIEAWVDLMEAVEALCPRWPEREISIGRDYRL